MPTSFIRSLKELATASLLSFLPALAMAGEVSVHADTDVAALPASARYEVLATEDGFVASNATQGWIATFDERGFLAQPIGTEWTWGLELESYGFDGNEQTVGTRACASATGKTVTYAWDEFLDEWFINDKRGIEHGFTVHARPDGQDDDELLRLSLRVRGNLLARVQAGGRGVDFLNEQGATILNYSGLVAFDADGRDLPAHLEALGTSLVFCVDERDARYPLTIDPIAQQAYTKASNSEADDEFGRTIAMSGDTLVIGAWSEDSSATGIDGDQSDNSAPQAGAAYVFVRQGSTWSQEAYLKASNTDAGDEFGVAVAIDGDTLVIGASSEASNGDQLDNGATRSGAVYVFVRQGTTWSQEAYLKASNSETDDRFGASVAVEGDRLVIGASHESSAATGANGDQTDNDALSAGAVYVFERTGTSWSQEGYLKASNSDVGSQFGFSVAVTGDTIMVGAPFERGVATGINGIQLNSFATFWSGAAYVFVRSGTTWTQEAYIKASNNRPFWNFGHSVVAEGDLAVATAPHDWSSGTGINGNQLLGGSDDVGSAFVFARTGTTWIQEAYIKASNAGDGDLFGSSAALSNGKLAIGAVGEASNAVDANGNQSDDSSPNAGAAYVFSRTGTVWSQDAYLKASNSESDDEFGFSMALAGDTIVVGATGEDSDADGIDGDQGDNLASNSGAVYVTNLNATPSPVSDFCFGDGLGLACKCGNDDSLHPSTGGCLNARGLGARLITNGSTSVSLNQLQLDLVSATPDTLALLSSGDNRLAGGLGVLAGPDSAGLLCIDGAIIRHGGRDLDTAGATMISWGATGSPPAGLIGKAGFMAGQTRHFQARYRQDTVLGSCGLGANSSQAISILFTP